jgi:long-subunit fatty acid transport protein
LVQYVETSKTSGIDIVDPRIINIYEYSLKTPSILSIGLAHVFGSKGLITFQYDLTDFSNLKFDVRDGDINFINQNNKIERSLKSAGILKLGGEYRVNRLSFRLGYFNQQSINKTINDVSNGYSFGLGYDLGGSLLNIGILNQNIKKSESMYQEGLTDIIYLRNRQEQFFISLAVKL